MAEPRRMRPSTFRCAAATVLALLVVIFIVVLLWLFLHPSKLYFSVDHAATTGLNFTAAAGGGLAGAFDLTLRAFNPNARAGVAYRWADVGVWYKGTYLAGAHAPGFFQQPGDETRVDVVARAAPDAGVLPRDVEEGMKKERTAGKLTVDVHVVAKVRFRYGVVSTRKYTVRASCLAVPIDLASPTSFDRVYCHVHI